MADFNITGRIIIELDFDIEASDEDDAVKIAEEYIKDYYRLDVNGAYHDPETVELEIFPYEFE